MGRFGTIVLWKYRGLHAIVKTTFKLKDIELITVHFQRKKYFYIMY